MRSDFIKHIIRFVIILILQVLVLKGVTFESTYLRHIQIFIYPLFILLLPVRTPDFLVVIIGFVLGLSVDMFYDSVGVHASACVFSAYFRSFLLKWLAPREGYKTDISPSKKDMGLGFFISFCGIFLFAHLLFYYSMELFSFYYFIEIWLKTISSFIFSTIFILLYVFILNPN